MLNRYKSERETEIKHEELNAVIYLEESNDKYLAKGFSGRRSKPDFYYNFRSEEQRQAYIDKWLNGLRQKQELKQERLNKRKEFKHSVKPGDIFYTSWGYDQTNINFYQVIKVIGKNTVKIREIATKDVGNNQGHFMSATKIALKDHFLEDEKELIKKINPNYDNSPYIRLYSFACATLWDGTPKNYSWYA